MNVLLYLEDSAIRGGIEVFAERQAAALRASGASVELARVIPDAFDSWDQIIVHKCSDAATLERFPPEKTTLFVHDHAPICPRTYAYTPLRHNCARPGSLWPCLLCAPLCKNAGAALGRVLSQKRRLRAMSRLRRIVVLSAFMKDRLVANGIPSGKIVVEPPTISLPRNGGDSRSPALPRDMDLLFVGQLIRGKGLQLLLRARAAMRSPRLLDVVGTGNMEPSLRSLATRLGLASRVRWRGFQTAPADWMRAARCVVVPSFWQEPYGLVAAEAVALGTPVVAFAIGGLPEACAGRATLVPPGNVRALADALDALSPRPHSES